MKRIVISTKILLLDKIQHIDKSLISRLKKLKADKSFRAFSIFHLYEINFLFQSSKVNPEAFFCTNNALTLKLIKFKSGNGNKGNKTNKVNEN